MLDKERLERFLTYLSNCTLGDCTNCRNWKAEIIKHFEVLEAENEMLTERSTTYFDMTGEANAERHAWQRALEEIYEEMNQKITKLRQTAR